MLFQSKNKIINIVRGDSGSIDVSLNIGTPFKPNLYNLRVGDKVYFGVTEPNQSFEDAILKKVLTIDNVNEDNTVTIEFKPMDTEYLLSGRYYYSVKLEINQIGEYQIHTIIPKTKFIVED